MKQRWYQILNGDSWTEAVQAPDALTALTVWLDGRHVPYPSSCRVVKCVGNGELIEFKRQVGGRYVLVPLPKPSEEA